MSTQNQFYVRNHLWYMTQERSKRSEVKIQTKKTQVVETNQPRIWYVGQQYDKQSLLWNPNSHHQKIGYIKIYKSVGNLWLGNTTWLQDVWCSQERFFWGSTWVVYATLNLPNDYFCSENVSWFITFLSKMLRHVSEVLKKICCSVRIESLIIYWRGVTYFSNDLIVWNKGGWEEGRLRLQFTGLDL